ncbi:unnamed protein product [Rotaria socialis]|nr:unnamed protein product [Rotaria socialis]CAF3470139.1 unnamed protein product [Rotaria socialis]CAF3591139.1 unnamed protein product [Rotaria socialis]CAF3660520.1 unnamed protein product [Rotaria socialis]
MRLGTTARRRPFRRTVRPVRTSGGSGNAPPDVQNGHVSLANIATAFLTERKSSSRRQTSVRRKTHLTIKGRSSSNAQRQSNYPTGVDELLEQRLSGENMDGSISTLFVPTSGIINSDGKQQSKLVKKNSDLLFFLD